MISILLLISDEDGAQRRRQWVIHQLCTLVKTSKIPKNKTWLAKIAKFILKHSLYIERVSNDEVN